MTERLRITGGRVYDPRNGVDGEVRDVCIEDGRIVAELPPDAPSLDARGTVVMPGGVDIHSHIAGPLAHRARCLVPERRREEGGRRRRAPDARRARGAHGARGAIFPSDPGGAVPSTFATGYGYAALGYTTAFDAAVPPVGARHAHHELDDTPILDKGFYLLLGNDPFLLRQLAAGEDERARAYIAWALGAARAYAIKVVNPGGVHAWRRGAAIAGLDDPLPGTAVTPRRIVEAIADAADTLGLPHPMHIHCNHLGVAGNYATTLETMRALDGRRAHLAHIQFHAYGGEPGARPTSRARELIEHLDAHPTLSADVGQVLFGDAVLVTADTAAGASLRRFAGKSVLDDIELGDGCCALPYAYRERGYVHALQWAVGLELFLLAADPWRVVLSTDHPNGASFHAYPRLIRLLMDRAYRDEWARRIDPRALRETALADGLDREYGLYEIAIVTRAGPARLLGLERKGHLGPGADADITIYDPNDDVEAMFSAPRHVIKHGTPVIADGELRRDVYGRTFHVAPTYDPAVEPGIRRFLEEYGTVGADQLRIDEAEVRRPERVPCHPEAPFARPSERGEVE